MSATMFVRSRGVPVVALIALSLVAGACSLERSGYQFVRDRPTGTYLKVPDEWKVYGPKELQKHFEARNPGAEKFPFISVFDAEPGGDLDFDIAADEPVGLVRVRELTPGERDSVSFASAREELYDSLNDDIASGQLPIRASTEITSKSADGQRIVFSITDDDTGAASTINQTTLVDRNKSRIYLLIMGCRSTCYDRHRKQIETVAASLTIKES